MAKGNFITEKILRELISDISKPIPLTVKVKDQVLPVSASVLQKYMDSNLLLLSDKILGRIQAAIKEPGRDTGKKKVESKKASAQTYLSHDEKLGTGVKRLNVIKKLGSAMIAGITAVLGEGTEEDPIVARYTSDCIVISRKSFGNKAKSK